MLIEGSDFSKEGSILEFDLNLDIAKNLGSPVVLVDNAQGKTLEEFCGNMESAVTTYTQKGIEILAVIANKVRPENLEMVRNNLASILPPDIYIAVIPRVKNLSHPTVKEIVAELEGKVLFGAAHVDNQTGSFGVGAMQLHNYLMHLRERSLVITPGDRSDIILGALQAHRSDTYPTISGMLLTGGILPEPAILKLLKTFSDAVPIVSVPQGTFEATNRVGNIKSKIYAESKQKISTSISLFNEYIDGERLLERLSSFKSKVITPQNVSIQPASES